MAAKKDLKTLEECVDAKVEGFMSNWNSSKAFRNDYQKRILASFDMQQLSRDGQMRSPDEKPLITAEARRPGKLVGPKAAPIAHKEDPQITAEPEILPPRKVRKESRQKNEETAIKTAIRAQKEAEKKKKEREKKLKKKGARSEITASEKEPADKEVE